MSHEHKTRSGWISPAWPAGRVRSSGWLGKGGLHLRSGRHRVMNNLHTGSHKAPRSTLRVRTLSAKALAARYKVNGDAGNNSFCFRQAR